MFADRKIWDLGHHPPDLPVFVRRMSNLTVINDRDHGPLVVDDDGHEVLRLPVERSEFGAGPIVSLGPAVAAVASDGHLHILDFT